MVTYTTVVNTDDNALGIVGGKGRSLALLAAAGFNTPGGFQVNTHAYRSFIAENNLQARIIELAQPTVVDGRVSYENASQAIAALIGDAVLSDAIANEIINAYRQLEGEPAVAVRSSATAEDLPGLSFAGQQETYLNIRGATELVAAVKRCWASLWTTQAISYRHQNGIDQDSVAMAVVVQLMVPADVSGILFTANPATGERSEMVVNASFGLGEAVVSGQVTPDTYIIDRATQRAKQTMIGPKARRIVVDDGQGVRIEDVPEAEREQSSLSAAQLGELATTALEIEALYEGLPQDIEWGYSDGKLHLFQSRPITHLPVQPVEVKWEVPPPATFVSRRQIVENMPDPICPLFEELYLTEGLESVRKGKSLMVGGGPMFITINGYAYQRFDFPVIHQQQDAQTRPKPVTEQEIEAAEQDAEERTRVQWKDVPRPPKNPTGEAARIAAKDLGLFRADLSEADRAVFDAWVSKQRPDGLAHQVTMPESDNPTYTAFFNTEWNDRQLGEWHEVTRPRLMGVRKEWSKLDISSASAEELLEGIRNMGIEEGYYWSSNASHSFGVAKSTDDQLQCFLRETLPNHHFISGQFLSGIESKTMQANADLFEIAKLVRASDALSYVVITTPAKFLMETLKQRNDSRHILDGIETYLATYGHQGYSLDFVEPTQIEDPSALFATLKAMVRDRDYDPSNQSLRAARIRTEKFAEISELLSGLEYWQFRFRLWLAHKYNYLREEVAFLFGYTWSVLRPMATELGRRMVEVGTFQRPDDTYFLVSGELRRAIKELNAGQAAPELGALAAKRRQLREARKAHHPPGTLPFEASEIGGIAFKETQIRNDESDNTMRGFPVSSGQVTAKASVILSAAEFDKMEPGSILVSPLTTPAWTQLFAHAVGLVTDVGSILAHGSIVAREYGIPAVLGVGNGTRRIKHGQTMTIDGDAGTVVIHSEND